MTRALSFLLSGLVLAGCELTSPDEFFPAAVVEGLVQDSLALPVEGAEIHVAIHRDDCAAPARTVVPLDSDGPVTTGEDGRFSAVYHFLFTGPVTVACTTVRVMAPQGGPMLADSTLEEPTEWTSPATDTIRMDFQLIGAPDGDDSGDDNGDGEENGDGDDNDDGDESGDGSDNGGNNDDENDGG